MYKILCLYTGEYVHGMHDESKDYVIKVLNNPRYRFYMSTVFKCIMLTSCNPNIIRLGGEIPKHLLEVVEVD